MMLQYFNDFDFASFWENDDYSVETYIEENLTDKIIQSVENDLGYKLPKSYIEFMRFQNGGTPTLTCFPTTEPTSWAEDHIAISGIHGIGRNKKYSLCGALGSQFMIDEGGYPPNGIYICDCPSAGHDLVLLDYTKCGIKGEPEVVHVDQEDDYKITFLAKDFETFIKGLVGSDKYEISEPDINQSELERYYASFSNKKNDLSKINFSK